MRRCIGCRQSKPQDELLRFTTVGQTVVADTDGKNDGRGFYLCKDKECLEMALKKKAFNRILKCNADTEEITRIVNEVLITK